MTTNITKLPGSVTGDASLKRPKFSSGLLLQDDDLTQTVDYMRNMTRLLFKSILGCGVLCGFKVKASIVCNDHLKIAVAKGVALDCHGDLIELLDQEIIEYAPSCGEALPEMIWIVICHKERDCAPRDVLCSAQDGEIAPVYTRTREGYQIKIIDNTTQPDGSCGCESASTIKINSTPSCCDYIATGNDTCYESHYNGHCACDCACDCIVLARVYLDTTTKEYKVDHSVRRFIRPVLMRDPLLPEPQTTTSTATGTAMRAAISATTNKQTKSK